jgi:hypothetical protein
LATDNDGKTMQKGLVTYHVPDAWKGGAYGDDAGEITTEWLSDPIGAIVARLAWLNKGEYCTFYRLNAVGDEGDDSDKGFKRLIWLDGPVPFSPKEA